MKILAHSVVPVNPVPYLHLGYISATTSTLEKPNAAFYSVGMLVVIGVIIAVWYRRASKRLSQFGLHLAFFGVLALMGIGCLGPIRYIHPERVTVGHASQSLKKIATYHQSGKPIPKSLPVLQRAAGLPEKWLKDGWMRPFRYLTAEGDEGAAVVLASAGMDGRFNTRDDYIGAYGETVPALQTFLADADENRHQEREPVPVAAGAELCRRQ